MLWVQDLWFGKAIVLLAHLRMLQGSVEGAQVLIEDYRPQLEGIDEELAKSAKAFLVVEMNTGQMLDDVLRAASGRIPVEFYGRLGGVVPFPDEILAEIQRMARGALAVNGDPRQAWMQRLKLIINN